MHLRRARRFDRRHDRATGAGPPNNDATNGLAPIRQADEVKCLGLPTDIGPGQVVVHDLSHDYGMSIQFSDGQFANPAALKDVARAVIKRLKPAAKTGGATAVTRRNGLGGTVV